MGILTARGSAEVGAAGFGSDLYIGCDDHGVHEAGVGHQVPRGGFAGRSEVHTRFLKKALSTVGFTCGWWFVWNEPASVQVGREADSNTSTFYFLCEFL